MQFSKVLGLSAAVSVASAAYANVTSTAEVYSNQTTVITVTSCEENACSEVPVTTGVTVVTSTIEGVVTEYTTYCPLSTTAAPAPSTKAPASEGTSTATAQVTSTIQNATTPASVSSYEGAAAKAVPAVAAIAAGVALLF